MRNAWKRSLALLCLLSLLTALGACGGRAKSENALTELFGSAMNGKLRVSVGEKPDSLNPVYGENATAQEFFLLVYDPLWRYDENYEPTPCLVDTWDTSYDGLTWTIRLRQDVLFSDGTALTAADVKFSYELFRQYSALYAPYFEGIRSIECPDTYTLVVTTDYVKGDMLYNPTPILPKHIWSQYASSPSSMDNRAMIGSGPFVYQAPTADSTEEAVSWSFLSNADYFGGAPKIEELSFTCYEIAANAANALIDGSIDACMGLTDAQLVTLADQAGIEVLAAEGPGRGYSMLAMNTASDVLADERVREAVRCCVDEERIFTLAFGSAGSYGSSFIEPGSVYHLDAGGSSDFDKTRALNLLLGAGYKDVDNDGVLEMADNVTELRVRIYTGEDDVWASAAVTILSGDLQEIGIATDWKTVEGSAADACGKGGDWDVCLCGQLGDVNPVVEAMLFAQGKHLTGWQDETYDAAYARLCGAMDTASRAELCRQLQQIVADGCPCVLLGYGTDVQAIRADLWSGYEESAASSGGLFGTGTYQTYMNITPASESETTAAATGEMTAAPEPG